MTLKSNHLKTKDRLIIFLKDENGFRLNYNIPTGWLSVSYMKTRYYTYDDALIIRPDYRLSQYTINQVNTYYRSMGSGWIVHNTNENIC